MEVVDESCAYRTERSLNRGVEKARIPNDGGARCPLNEMEDECVRRLSAFYVEYSPAVDRVCDASGDSSRTGRTLFECHMKDGHAAPGPRLCSGRKSFGRFFGIDAVGSDPNFSYQFRESHFGQNFGLTCTDAGIQARREVL